MNWRGGFTIAAKRDKNESTYVCGSLSPADLLFLVVRADGMGLEVAVDLFSYSRGSPRFS